MKLTPTKVDEQYICVIPDIGILSFSELPPMNYCWSGYTRGEEDFIKHNFGNCCVNDKACHMCSTENGVALLEYIDRFAFERKHFSELEQCLIEDMAYWFFLAWESGERHYNDLPEWCHSIIEVYIKHGYIHRVTIENDKYEGDVFIFDKADLFLHCKQDIEDIVQSALIECLEEKQDQ